MGKTAVLKSLLPLLDQSGESPCVCKIDCLQSKDAVTFQKMKYPCVTGLSGDICPDHFLVRHTMPSGVCSYCVGETRVGTAYQQGVVGKIDFKENAICKQ